jgi:hypothetical protein
MEFRISSPRLSLLEKRAALAIMLGYRVVRPIYVDWFWRGYSVVLQEPISVPA